MWSINACVEVMMSNQNVSKMKEELRLKCECFKVHSRMKANVPVQSDSHHAQQTDGNI